MTLHIHDLRDELRETTGMDSDDLTDTVANRYLNLSWWELQDKIKFREKEGIADIATVAGTASYALTSIDAALDNVVSVNILSRVGDDYAPLRKRDYTSILDGLNTSDSARGVPNEYAIHANLIYFDPIPDSPYTVRVLFRKTLANLVSGVAPVPQVWHEFIILGAAMRVFRRNGEYQKSAAIRMERDALILITVEDITKETEDFRHAGIQVYRQRYP
jgi:hypothetical protein